MTKAQMIEQVYLNVIGGEVSPDANVQREDIANLLPAAVNYAIVAYNRMERREIIEEIRLLGGSGVSSKMNQEFLTTKVLSVQKDEARDLYYIELPFKVQTLPGNRGLDEVAPMQGTAPYVKVASRREIYGLEDCGTIFYWPEKVPENRIYLTGLGLPVCDHLVKVVVSVADINDSEEIPMPAALEFEVIKLMCEFFRAQRDGQGDSSPDDKDEVE